MDYKARFYSPALGRFQQPDTVVPGVENPQAWNRYSYTYNNPIRYNDPDGHCPICIPILAGAIIGAAISTATYVATAKLTGQEITTAGVLGAVAAGAIGGAISVIATPLAGTLVRAVGLAATNTTLLAGSVAVNAVGGGLSYLAGGYTENAINRAQGNKEEFKPTVGGLATNMAFSGLYTKVTGIGNPNGMRTLLQAEYFMAGRTLNSVLSQGAKKIYSEIAKETFVGFYFGAGEAWLEGKLSPKKGQTVAE